MEFCMSRNDITTVVTLIVGVLIGAFTRSREAVHAAFWKALEVLDLDLQVEGAAKSIAGTPHAERGQLGFQTLVAAFIVVITGMAVVLVLDKFDASLGTPSNNDLSNSSGNLLTGFSSMVDLIEPLLLIAIVVVLIALVRRVG